MFATHEKINENVVPFVAAAHIHHKSKYLLFPSENSLVFLPLILLSSVRLSYNSELYSTFVCIIRKVDGARESEVEKKHTQNICDRKIFARFD